MAQCVCALINIILDPKVFSGKGCKSTLKAPTANSDENVGKENANTHSFFIGSDTDDDAPRSILKNKNKTSKQGTSSTSTATSACPSLLVPGGGEHHAQKPVCKTFALAAVLGLRSCGDPQTNTEHSKTSFPTVTTTTGMSTLGGPTDEGRKTSPAEVPTSSVEAPTIDMTGGVDRKTDKESMNVQVHGQTNCGDAMVVSMQGALGEYDVLRNFHNTAHTGLDLRGLWNL